MRKDNSVQSITGQKKKVRFDVQQEQGKQDNTERKKKYVRNQMAAPL